MVTTHHNQVLIQRFSNKSRTYSEVEKLLHKTAIHEQTTSTLVEDDPLAVTLTFNHQYVATAAAAIIQHRGELMFSTQLPVAAFANQVLDENSAEPPGTIDQLGSDDERSEASVFLKDDAVSTERVSIAPSEMRSTTSESTTSDAHTLSTTGDNAESSGIVVTPLPVAAYSKARRILLPSNRDCPLLTVSMRADINFFSQATKYAIQASSYEI